MKKRDYFQYESLNVTGVYIMIGMKKGKENKTESKQQPSKAYQGYK